MYSSKDIEYLNSLKDTNPEIYDHITDILHNQDEEIRLASHDLRNIITLIYGNYQLISLSNPELAESNRWLQIESDLQQLTDETINLKARLQSGLK